MAALVRWLSCCCLLVSSWERKKEYEEEEKEVKDESVIAQLLFMMSLRFSSSLLPLASLRPVSECCPASTFPFSVIGWFDSGHSSCISLWCPWIISSSPVCLPDTVQCLSCLRSTGNLGPLGDDCSSAVGSQWIRAHASVYGAFPLEVYTFSE